MGQAIVFRGLPSSVGRTGAPTAFVGPSVSTALRATEVYENHLRPAHAVYQGTASAVPQEAFNHQGFSPCRRQGVFDAAFFWPVELVLDATLELRPKYPWGARRAGGWLLVDFSAFAPHRVDLHARVFVRVKGELHQVRLCARQKHASIAGQASRIFCRHAYGVG